MQQQPQLYAIIQVDANQSQTFDIRDPNNYDESMFEENIRSTFRNGVPAWGNGQFSNATAILLCLLGCIGCNGMQRLYVGDTCFGVCCCLTYGCYYVGQCLDCCLIHSVITQRNAEIRSRANNKYRQRMQAQQGQVNISPVLGGYNVGNRPLRQNPVYSSPASSYPAASYHPQYEQQYEQQQLSYPAANKEDRLVDQTDFQNNALQMKKEFEEEMEEEGIEEEMEEEGIEEECEQYIFEDVGPNPKYI
ncbi:MAG: hypothetical protein EZS28_021978 [Streblomastix strix]|uniref:TM2 domain-containing protein n=1 Tax=Streblomastix strix TaxID=222440 RepID=A0A5J4VJ78_9EUKA|nr:MAG: hypothetical protein EZS28_021978 [Streblomastix strix]